MNFNSMVEIKNGLETAFIDKNFSSNLAYKPQFVSNNHLEGRKVLSIIEEELANCDEFAISVAFIRESGIKSLLMILKELERKNIPGRILTTDYMKYSDPKALKKLASFKNIEVRMYYIGERKDDGFHTKGYIFKNEDVYKIIVGSSNMTAGALTTSKEWNTKLVSTEQGEYVDSILGEFEQLWDSKHTESFDVFYEKYKIAYETIKKQREIAKAETVTSVAQYQLQPNKMQVEFINNLRKLIQNGEKKALLISATGTGKTYASAFALRDQNPEKVLFIVHREQIAKQALKSYKNVFGSTKKFALLSGNSKDFDEISKADYVFATMQMMAKPEIMNKFNEDYFSVCLIDEVHKAGAESYQRIISYFKPELWLGMTASPDRTDGFDIYQLFDHNIAYEIRLQQALEENLLCPFHYFGITDLEIDGEVFDDNTGVRNFANLVCDKRIDYVLEQIEFYGYSGNRAKGLIFCSRKEEAKELSRKFNERGFNTIFLCGEDSQEAREDAIARLEQDERDGGLDYIFTVDIFNEGVDIPAINQVIMLRPTESPIIFIQQLGRGLRKAENKEYVIILDFIGNYMNNFMIPIALSGDRTYNKDTIRRYVREGSLVIPGCSTIHFDEISKKRIFQSIDATNTTKKFLKEKYMLLKNKLGRVPTILDFYEYGEIDPMLFIDYSKTYDQFVRMVDTDYHMTFSQEQEAFLEFVSSILVNGKRPHELLILQMLLNEKDISEERFAEKLGSIGEKFRVQDYKSAKYVLYKDFVNTQSEKKKYEVVEFVDSVSHADNLVGRAKVFEDNLLAIAFKRELTNLIEYGLCKYNDCYKKHDEDNLVLYEKYSRKDVCRILNWEKDDSSTIYGYRIKYNTCPIFVTYEKKDDIVSSTKYEDQFVNNSVFSWMTRSKVSISSLEAQQLINYNDTNLKIYLFIKKSDGEGSDFYYMGKVKPVEWRETTIKDDKGRELPIMNFLMQMENSVRNDIYEYFTK